MEALRTVFAGNPVLSSQRILLRKLTRADAEDLYDYARREEVSRYLLWSPHPSLRYTKRYLSTVSRQYKNGLFYDFAVVLKSENRMIGTCGFTSCHEESAVGEVGYVLSPDYRGQGLATEAVLLLLRWGFCNLGMNRIEARYIVGNDASLALMERCGMRREGICRQLMFVKGTYRDIGVCAILREEFRQAFGGAPVGREGTWEKKPAASPFLGGSLF